MSVLRAAWRLFLVVKLTAIGYLAVTLGSLLTLPLPRRRARWRHLCFRLWSRSVLAVMGARVDSRGPPPEPPFFLVTNHLGYVDVLVLASQVDGVFIAKSEAAGWPVIGSLCRSVGTMFVDRRVNRDGGVSRGTPPVPSARDCGGRGGPGGPPRPPGSRYYLSPSNPERLSAPPSNRSGGSAPPRFGQTCLTLRRCSACPWRRAPPIPA